MKNRFASLNYWEWATCVEPSLAAPFGARSMHSCQRGCQDYLSKNLRSQRPGNIEVSGRSASLNAAMGGPIQP